MVSHGFNVVPTGVRSHPADVWVSSSRSRGWGTSQEEHLAHDDGRLPRILANEAKVSSLDLNGIGLYWVGVPFILSNMMLVGQIPMGSHVGVAAPPILVHFSGDWDVYWGYGI